MNELVARKLGHESDRGEIFVKGKYKLLPDYCHSIAAAWEIIDHCEHNLVLYQIDLSHSRTGSSWYCTLGTKNQYNEGVGADTAPMAICLAFLKLHADH